MGLSAKSLSRTSLLRAPWVTCVQGAQQPQGPCHWPVKKCAETGSTTEGKTGTGGWQEGVEINLEENPLHP